MNLENRTTPSLIIKAEGPSQEAALDLTKRLSDAFMSWAKDNAVTVYIRAAPRAFEEKDFDASETLYGARFRYHYAWGMPEGHRVYKPASFDTDTDCGVAFGLKP